MQFARVASRIQKEVEALPEATEEEDEAEARAAEDGASGTDHASRSGQGEDASGSDRIGPGAGSRWGDLPVPKGDVGRVEGASGADESREIGGAGLAEFGASTEDDPFGIGDMMAAAQGAGAADASDPFGLSAMMQQNKLMSKVLKQEMRTKKRKEGQLAAERAAAEASRLLRERREALVVCLQSATSKYSQRW